MPEIEITEDQRDRLRAVQEALEADVVGKYGHVRASDAVEYLLDRYEAGDAGPAGTAVGSDGAADGGSDDATAGAGGDGDADGGGPDPGAGSDDRGTTDGNAAAAGADDAELDAVMNLLDEYGDRWRESDASDARYEVDLPDGTTERARTKDDVRGLLFRHYR